MNLVVKHIIEAVIIAAISFCVGRNNWFYFSYLLNLWFSRAYSALEEDEEIHKLKFGASAKKQRPSS